jgi:hypothetical protein
MASGQTLLIFNAQAGVPPTANSPQLDTRNNHLVWDFDAAANEILDFETALPRNYNGGGLTLAIIWSATTAASGVTRWLASFERHQADVTDIDSDSFATAQAVNATAPGTNGARSYDEIAFTDGAQIDNLAVGESFRLRIERDATNAADTMLGDAELARIEIRET